MKVRAPSLQASMKALKAPLIAPPSISVWIVRTFNPGSRRSR